MARKTLIFPGGMPGSLAHHALCLSSNVAVIGASSLSYDPNSAQYQEWAVLPFLTAPEFDAALDAVIADHGVTDIFTPHPIVWDHLNDRASRGTLPVSLLKPSAVEDVEPYRHALRRSNLTALPVHLGDKQAPLSGMETASLLYHAEKISGMCDSDKTRALIEIFRAMPPGDVVEIGSWWGKSAFIMHRLSHIYGIGPLLCIDPWANENFVQNDSSGLVDRLVATIDADETHRIFVINLLPYANGDANYLRMPAQQALEAFSADPDVTSPEFGSTRYSGRIAVLHIDGNHAYEHAKADIVGWTKLVTAGGWIIIDDYVWPWGDGPQRAGDELLAAHAEKIGCVFVMGTALFIQLRDVL